MKAKKKTGGQSKSQAAASSRRFKRKSLRRDKKTNSLSPESTVSTARRSTSRTQQRGHTSSPSDVSSVSSRRSLSKGKNSSGEGSCSRSPPDRVDVLKSSCKRSSSRSKAVTAQITNVPSDRNSELSEDNGVDTDLQVSLIPSSSVSGCPDLETAPLKSVPLDLAESCSNVGNVELKSKNESPEGRRTSGRQRKPSWRVNFDPSDLLEDKQNLKQIPFAASNSKTSKAGYSIVDKHNGKKAKMELPHHLSPISNLALNDSKVPNGDSISLLMITNNQRAVTLEEKLEDRRYKIKPEMSIEGLSSISGSDSRKDLISTIQECDKFSFDSQDNKVNGSREGNLTDGVTEVIDITDDAEMDAPIELDSFSSKSTSSESEGGRICECCCTEASNLDYNLKVDAESVEAFASDYLSDKEDSLLPSELFCQAVDLVGSNKVGCYRVASDDLIVYRVSQRCPFRLLCPHHTGRLKLHQCCPICGYFCTHGPGIMLCTGNMDSARSSVGDAYKLEPKWTSHLFHKTCAIQEISKTSVNETDDNKSVSSLLDNNIEILSKISCPHCGEDDDIKEISLTLKTCLPVSIPTRPPAKRKLSLAICRNSTHIPQPEDNTLRYVEESAAATLARSNEEAKLLLSESSYSTDTKSFLKYLLKDELAFITAAIMKNKSLVNARFKYFGGQSPLHLAVSNRNICLAHGLIIGGANPNIVDDEYMSPLMLAAKLNEPTLAKYLIASGADKFHKDPNGMNVIHISAAAGNLMVLQGILEDHPELLQTVDSAGMTALMHGAKNAKTEVVNYLATFWPLETNVRAVDRDKNTPLHWAAASGAVQAVSVLLKQGAEVNSKNNTDETPLHWAVAHGRDGCVLTLLVNQAEILLTDVDGKTPLDLCTDENNKSTKYKKLDETDIWWNGDSLNNIKKTIKQCLLQTLTLRSQTSHVDNRLQLRMVSKDVSRGKEPHNIIQCVNSVDDAKLPENFKYITSSVFSCKSIQQPILNVLETHYCSCDANFADASSVKAQTNDENIKPDQALPFCLSKSCSCSVQNYDVKERLFSQKEKSNPAKLPVIKECNQLCGCDARLCCNRVVQRGSKCELQVFRTKHNGWGVKTLGRIPRGSFVCTYEGEIIDSVEASTRISKYADSYMFDIYGGQILLDATEFGNVARFINHSCAPNLVPVKVLTDHQDLRFPHIAFFAKFEIQANEELCFDYGPKFWTSKLKEGLYCLCRTEECVYGREDEEDINGDDEVFSSDIDNVISDSDEPEDKSTI
ncbi:unnamed protein product [Allacma fusca]|uniref:Histone-lysine N-methyltransferase EHMT1 n=1 Tax=Allacma fusca TaxID=39272 RepID=A0A8J2KS08_9HEXA|nr:unnamed protein product [Allacma fusca]